MLHIPQEKISERWDNLPQPLREAIFSEENGAIIETVAQKNNLDENKEKLLALLVGDVLRGFINYDLFLKMFKEDLSIEDEKNQTNFREIKSKIFDPLEKDIVGAYHPLEEYKILKNTTSTSLEETEKKLSEVSEIKIAQPNDLLKESISQVSTTPSQETDSGVVIPTPASPISPQPDVAEKIPTPLESPEKITPSVMITPDFEKISDVPPPSPFMIHEETAPQKAVSENNNGSPLRPMFYAGEPEMEEKAAFTKLEFGKTDTNKKVDPDNIVDLKDLPL
jgi:hypothetical protein